MLIGVLLPVHIFRDNSSDPQNALENKAFAFDTNIGNESVPLYNSTHIDTPYIKEYSMPNGTWPNGILVDKNGIVWTVGTKSHTLLSFDPNQGRVIAFYPIPQESQKNATRTNSVQSGVSMAWALVQDKNGSIWFSQADSPNPLWRFDPSTKKFESIRMVSEAPYQILEIYGLRHSLITNLESSRRLKKTKVLATEIMKIVRNTKFLNLI